MAKTFTTTQGNEFTVPDKAVAFTDDEAANALWQQMGHKFKDHPKGHYTLHVAWNANGGGYLWLEQFAEAEKTSEPEAKTA